MYILYDRFLHTEALCRAPLYKQCMHVDRIMIMQAGMPACMQYYNSSSCLHFVHQVVWKPLFFIRSRCAMALNDPIDDVEMIDDTSSTATIEIEWTRWWNKPSEHWPGYTSWEVLRWWAKRTRPWAMNSFPLFRYRYIIYLFGPLSASCQVG